METSFVDYRYTLSLVERINRYVEDEPSLQKLFIVSSYNLWQRNQASLFSDAKGWSKSKRLSQTPASILNRLKIGLVGLCLLVVSILSAGWAMLTRKNCWIFTEDRSEGAYQNDFRIEPIYSALAQERRGFFEVLHTLSDRRTIKNLFRRRRPVFYLESIDFLLAPLVWWHKRSARALLRRLDLTVFDSADRLFVAFELEKFISQAPVSMARLRIFSFLYKLSQVSLLFSIDDTRHYQEFVEAGRRLGIPSYAVQHGHFTKYHTGWLQITRLPGEVMRSKFILVWSDYWKRELRQLGTYFEPDEIVVGGERWHLPPQMEAIGRRAILIPYEQESPKPEVKKYIEKISEWGEMELIFKFREDKDKQTQLREYGIEGMVDRITLVRSIKDVSGRVGLVLGTYSSFLYDCVASGHAVAIMDTSLDYGLGMVTNGLAGQVTMNNLEDSLRSLAQTSKETLESRRNKLLGESPRDMTATIRSIILQHA